MEASIGAGDFKAKCLQLLDAVAAHREPLIITKRVVKFRVAKAAKDAILGTK